MRCGLKKCGKCRHPLKLLRNRYLNQSVYVINSNKVIQHLLASVVFLMHKFCFKKNFIFPHIIFTMGFLFLHMF